MTKTAASSTTYKGFKTKADMLEDLKLDFPYIQTTFTTTKTGAAVGKVSIKSTKSRNNYIKTAARCDDFAIGTALSIIGTFWGVTSVTAVAKVLTAMSISYSAANKLKEAAHLYKSGIYSFSGKWVGRAYDKTVYNAYVYVKKYSGTGEFTGGYDSSGIWRWVISAPCAVLNKTSDSVANATISAYNSDVALNGACTNYNPSGFN